MTRTIIAMAVLLTLLLGSWIAFETGLVRWAFYELFARVKGVDVVGQNVVRVPPQHAPYERWLRDARAQIPVMDGLVIDDINTVSLRPWPQMGAGVEGLYLRFADYQIIDGRIIQIPVGGKSASQRHFYEKGVYFLGGPGHTVIQQQGGDRQRVDWDEGSLLSIPLNVRHQHFNDSGEPVRLLAVTSFPFVLNSTNSDEFIHENPFVFEDRYDGDERYFQGSKRLGNFQLKTNFVDDILQEPTDRDEIRGEGASRVGWQMAANTMIGLHVSEMAPETYKKPHRHSSDAFILLLSGSGYSLAWADAHYNKRIRVDWQPGTLFVPPIYWYHQHLNSGSVPARFVAINAAGLVTNIGLRFHDQLEQDLPEIREEWEREIEKNKP